MGEHEDDFEDAPHDPTSGPPSADEDGTPATEGKLNAPLQKRRRVTRACDECRRKKIKCDGKQPCTHCTVYSYGNIHPCSSSTKSN